MVEAAKLVTPEALGTKQRDYGTRKEEGTEGPCLLNNAWELGAAGKRATGPHLNPFEGQGWLSSAQSSSSLSELERFWIATKLF